MSVDIHWDTVTSGPDGAALAERIRLFLHDRFQQVTLPRFIRSVEVHSFNFGTIAPEVEVKDVGDPLPDFYEEDADDDAAVHEAHGSAERSSITEASAAHDHVRADRGDSSRIHPNGAHESTLYRSHDLSVNTGQPGLRGKIAPTEQVFSPAFPGAQTPGIPGGTSNLTYFHLPLGGGISGTTTPLAAVAGAQFGGGRPDQTPIRDSAPWTTTRHHPSASTNSLTPPSTADPGSRPPSQHVYGSTARSSQSAFEDEHPMPGRASEAAANPGPRMRERNPEDLQVIAHVRYKGDVKLSLTAELLLDYPMPSFVGIPLKLTITGLTFDGVAILAYIKRHAHFCFLSPEDADALIDREEDDHANAARPRRGASSSQGTSIGSLLEEIKVESEIGKGENGKQVLKNVGKVEKFVLEQVRRIFEDEFVYPSFWTFIV